MRTIGSNGLVLLALMTGVAACAGSTTIYKSGPGEAPPDDPTTTTPDDPANTPDPSLTGDPTSKATPAPSNPSASRRLRPGLTRGLLVDRFISGLTSGSSHLRYA